MVSILPGLADPPLVRSKPPTSRQREVLDFIRSHLATRGYPPTVREIAEHFAISSPNGVNYHLAALERKGQIVRDRRVARGIRLINP